MDNQTNEALPTAQETPTPVQPVAPAPAQPAAPAPVQPVAPAPVQPVAPAPAQPVAPAPVQPAAPVNPAPVGQLNCKRKLWKYILFNILTFGIYNLVFYSGISSDINVIASRYDGKKTMHYCLLFFIFIPLTAGIALIVWMHKISKRIGRELTRRGISYKFSSGTFWLWNVLGSLIVVGPFIYVHKIAKASNLLAEDYNLKG